jgi:putative membrane protein
VQLKHAFPDGARRRIAAAVHDAEAGTSGEVVVVMTDEADAYEEAAWRGAAVLCASVLTLDLIYRYAAPFWLALPRDAGLLAALAAALLGFAVVPRVPAVRRLLVGPARRSARVRAAAEAAFRTQRVATTRDRTGVLVFISFFEREVVVLPDIGVEAKAPESAWAGVVDRVVAGMVSGRPVDGVVEAVRACGELLRAAGFTARPDDGNEIDDAPHFVS